MDIIAGEAEYFPLPHACFHCQGALRIHGYRERCCIRLGKKTWHVVKRYRCCTCGKTFTLLKKCMFPCKQHAAREIEEALSGKNCATQADEGTVNRWKREFKQLIPVLATFFEQLAKIVSGKTISFVTASNSPMKRLRQAFGLLVELSPEEPVIVHAFLIYYHHLLCIGCPAHTI